MSKKAEEQEEIVDAKAEAGAVVAKEDTAVSTEVQVSGVQLDFPFVKIGQGMSQWRTTETRNGKPEEGAFYIGLNKESNYKIAESGKDGGLYGIVLDRINGYKHKKPYNPGDKTPPKRWTVAGTKEDGAPVTDADVRKAIVGEGYCFYTPENWNGPNREKICDPFAYLLMLVPVPDTFESDEFRLYPIGDHLYTTVRFEWDGMYYKSFDSIMANIRSRAEFSAMKAGNRDFKYSPVGLVTHTYSCEAMSRTGQPYTSHAFEKALRDGKPWEFTDAEKADFARFLMSVKAGTANVDDVSDSEF